MYYCCTVTNYTDVVLIEKKAANKKSYKFEGKCYFNAFAFS